MPIIKIEGLRGSKTPDATFEFTEDSCIDILDNEGYLVARFDPEDFLAVADAYIAFKKRTDEKKRSENEDNKPA